MAPRSPGRTGHRWREVRKRVLDESDVCGICGHEGADAVDHIVPLSKGGDPLNPDNLRPAHGIAGCPTCGIKCNSARGAGRDVTPMHTSRQWVAATKSSYA